MKQWMNNNIVFLPGEGESPDLPVLLYGAGHDTVQSREYCFENESLSRYHRGEVFQMTLKGSGSFKEEGCTRPVPEGWAFLASAARPFHYSYQGGEPWEFLYLTFLGPTARDLFARWRRENGSLIVLSKPGRLIRRVRDIQENAESTGEYRNNSRTAYELLMLIDAAIEKTELTPTIRQQTEGMIRKDLRGISVESLARRWGYEPHYFITWLRNSIGITPGRLIREIRLESAAEYLIHSPRGISSIAGLCGFEDPGLFSRRFREYYGSSPREFRRQRQAPVLSRPVFLTREEG